MTTQADQLVPTFHLDPHIKPGQEKTIAQKIFRLVEDHEEGIIFTGKAESSLILHFADNSAIEFDGKGYRTGTLVFPKEVN